MVFTQFPFKGNSSKYRDKRIFGTFPTNYKAFKCTEVWCGHFYLKGGIGSYIFKICHSENCRTPAYGMMIYTTVYNCDQLKLELRYYLQKEEDPKRTYLYH